MHLLEDTYGIIPHKPQHARSSHQDLLPRKLFRELAYSGFHVVGASTSAFDSVCIWGPQYQMSQSRKKRHSYWLQSITFISSNLHLSKLSLNLDISTDREPTALAACISLQGVSDMGDTKWVVVSVHCRAADRGPHRTYSSSLAGHKKKQSGTSGTRGGGLWSGTGAEIVRRLSDERR